MDSLTLILKYIFNKYNLDVNFDSVESMFTNGISFPMFISAIFKAYEIEGFKKTPVSKSDIKSNNDLALQFLFQNNNLIDKSCKNYKSTANKKNLIAEILKKQCFKLDYQEILNQCNLIVEQLKVHYATEKDFLKIPNLITILSVLTNGEVSNDIGNTKDINIILSKSFEIAKVPFILDSKSFNNRNKYLFYIQISIIFEIYHDSIQKVSMKEKNRKKKSFLNFFRKNDELSNSSSESSSDYSDYGDEKTNEDIQNEALLNTINHIGSQFDISFQNIEDSVKNDSIPKFVINFFNLREIKNVQISDNFISENLTNQQIENIKAVIEFIIKEKKIQKFNTLLFNFEDYKMVESSTILFYQNFLNSFFLKNLKQEMYSKIAKLLCTHTSKFKEKYNEKLFTKYKIYPCLLHFIINKNLHFDFDYKKKKFNDDEVKEYFQAAKIPMIINNEMMKYSKRYVSYPIFYQLQFIFDALEKKKTASHRIIEFFVSFLFEFKKIEVPKFSEIALNIKSKRISLNYQKQMRNKYHIELRDQKVTKKVERIEILKPKTFLELNNENLILEMKMKIDQSIKDADDEEEITDETVQVYDIWNEPDPNYLNDNGILYNKNEFEENNKNDCQLNFLNEIKKITKSIQNKTSNQLNNFHFQEKQNKDIEPEIYKIFVFDESCDTWRYKEWKYNEDNFTKFSKDKNIDNKSLKTPIVLLFDSDENDLKTICSNFINTSYPNLDSDDEIFVYSFCDRSLNLLNFDVDSNNDEEKKAINPIFLLLHIPQSKQNLPDIKIIILRIYSFLSAISNINIIVLNQKHYLDQIEFLKLILKINIVFEKESSQINDDIDGFPFNFSIQKHSSEVSINHHFKSLYFRKKEYKPRFIFLINNDITNQINKEIDDGLQKSEFFKNIFSQINKEIYYHFININNINTYEYFLNTMNDILIKISFTYEKITTLIFKIFFFNFSEVYLQTILTQDYTILEKIYYRCSKIKHAKENLNLYNEKENEEENEAESETDSESFYYVELSSYIHANDYFMGNKCIKIVKSIPHRDCYNLKIRELLRENLKNCSDSYLSYLKQFINQKLFWNFQQLDNMIDSYKKFLKNEYFCIIRSLFNDDLFATAYECHYDLLDNQILSDKKVILEIMMPFIDKIKIKNCTKFHDLRNSMKEGTNYAMKETENLKEIKVAVQINKDLKSEIPQDF